MRIAISHIEIRLIVKELKPWMIRMNQRFAWASRFVEIVFTTNDWV